MTSVPLILNIALFGSAWLTARQPCLIIVHNRLVDSVCTVDELALPPSIVLLLVQQRDAFMHLKGRLRSW